MLLVFVLVLLLALLISGCSGAPTILAPASPGADSILGLFWGVVAVGAAIFLVVEGLLIFAVFRFRSRPDASQPDQVHGNLRLEIAWTLAPVLILVGIMAAMLQTMNSVSRQQPDALHVKVVGKQWWWEINYPDLGITTATDLHVPTGQPVEVELVADDVIHSFWAPELFGKSDLIPGHSSWTRFEAEKPGTFRGQCAEFCGVQHANMGFLIIAESPEQFEDWTKHMKSSAVQTSSGPAGRGAQAFLSGACVACHTIDGTRAQGKIGPNLTHFGSRSTIGALSVENTEKELSLWLANPQALKPGNKMPNLNLTQETIQDLVAYLESLK